MTFTKQEEIIMKKRTKEAANMFFSAFLVFAYVVCSYFILKLSASLTNPTASNVVTIAVIVVFGVLLFYATRVGDGKQIVRFSPSVLILIVLPAAYVVSAYFALGLPLHNIIEQNTTIIYFSAVALGYGIPYTFLSGFEMVAAEDVYFPEHFEDKDEDEEEDAVTDDEEK